MRGVEAMRADVPMRGDAARGADAAARREASPRARELGFTVVELLIAGFVLTVVLAATGFFLAQQSTLNKRTQAKAEVQDKTRMVMQLVTSDLQLAGASVYADASGALQTISPDLGICPTVGSRNSCLGGYDGAGGSSVKDHIATAYVTTLRPTNQACREVGYRFSGDDLLRADRVCTGAHVDTTSSAGFDTLATNVLALDVTYVCSNGVVISTVPDTTNCPPGVSYVRSALVSVVAQSDAEVPGQEPQTFTLSSGATVDCGADRYCMELTQEVLLTNLKDR